MIALLTSLALAGSVGSAPKPAGLEGAYAPRRVAVLIGVDNYTDPALQSLKFAAKDARDLGRVLGSSGNGDFDRVVTITGPESTSAAAIRKALAFATADLQRDDTFLLYVSGHGTLTIDPTAGTELWFLPSDARLANPRQTGISVNWFEDLVSGVEARRRVLIMDTCHNGRDRSALDPQTAALLASMRGEAPAPRETSEVSESEARLYAAQYYQPAMEDPTLQNGVYTHFIIQAMTTAAGQADLDGDGLVDVAEAHDWARDRTIAYTGGMQVPRAEYRIVGREEIWLAGDAATRSAAERALVAATDALLASAEVLIDGQSRGVLPEVIAVEPGNHTLEVRSADGQLLLRRPIDVVAGQTVMVEDLFPETDPHWELTAGVLARSGGGAAALHPMSPTLSAFWVRPVLGGKPWLQGEVGFSADALGGPVESEGPLIPVSAGVALAGGSIGWKPWRAPISVGPSAELGVVWRSFTDAEGAQRQGGLTVVPGARVALRVPVGEQQLVARYDLRYVPFAWEDGWSSVVQHGVSVGMSFQ